MVINAIFREFCHTDDQKGDLGNILKGQLGETEVENKNELCKFKMRQKC